MATTYSHVPQTFEIGRVFGMTFGVIGGNAPLYLGVGFVVSGLPQLLFGYYTAQSMVTTQSGSVTAFTAVSERYESFGLFWLAMMLLHVVLQAALSRATIEDLNGRRPQIGECLSVALAVLPQAIGVFILTGLAVILGMMFLIVPGFILALGWSVVIPVLVQERVGVFGSMNRSRALTKGSRWRLFGLFLVLCIAIWALQLLLGFAAGMIFSALGSGIAPAVAAGIVSTVSAALFTAAVSASYVELRQVREGTGVEDLAAIFA